MERICEKRIMKRIIRIGIAILLAGFIGCIVGDLRAGIRQSALNRAAIALEKTGLPEMYAPSYSLYGFTGFRDTFSQTKFIVQAKDEREQLFSDISSSKRWRVAPVTAEEYLSFQKTCIQWYSAVLDVPADIVFDAWYYRETSEPNVLSGHAPEGALEEIGHVGYGFEFAVYDRESGLFVFTDLFG